MIPLPGHTPGHCGIAVRSKDRWLLHAGDSYFHHGQLQARPSMPIVLGRLQRKGDMDRATRIANQERLRALKASHGHEITIVNSHDPVDYEPSACDDAPLTSKACISGCDISGWMTPAMHFSQTDASRIGDILAQAALSEIMPRFQMLDAGQVKQKSSSFDLVTEADEAAERVIADQLRAAFPGCIVVGEEATAKDGRLIEGIAGAELAFIVDPIDGTMNFASGLPLFGVILAATVKGEVVLSAIHEPVREDTAFALRGEGAWMQRKDGRSIDLRVAEAAPLSAMQAMVSTSFLPEPLRTVVNGNLSRIGMTSSLRCAAHEYRLAAAGHCHLLFYNKLMPWDHAAGWLLHREAGGYSAHFDGSEYRPTHLSGGLICAPDRESWQLARDALLEAA